MLITTTDGLRRAGWSNRAGLDVFKKKKLLWPYWDSHPEPCSP